MGVATLAAAGEAGRRLLGEIFELRGAPGCLLGARVEGLEALLEIGLG